MASIDRQYNYTGLEYDHNSITKITKPWVEQPCATKLLKEKTMC